MYMCPAVSSTPYDTSSKKKTADIITFIQFEEGELLPENHDDAESGDKSDDDSYIPPLISEEEIDPMDSGDEYEDEPMYTELSEDIRDSGQSHPSINRREERYKICDKTKQIQRKCKGPLLSTQNMGKGLHKMFKTAVK